MHEHERVGITYLRDVFVDDRVRWRRTGEFLAAHQRVEPDPVQIDRVDRPAGSAEPGDDTIADGATCNDAGSNVADDMSDCNDNNANVQSMGMDEDGDGTDDCTDPCWGADNVDGDADGICTSCDVSEGATGDDSADMDDCVDEADEPGCDAFPNSAGATQDCDLTNG